MATVKEIHDEFYAQFRGQGDSLPNYGNREFTLGMHLLRGAIRKWERSDGQLWRELIKSAVSQTVQVWANSARTVTGASAAAPNNMRKPPAFVFFKHLDGRIDSFKVKQPQDADERSVWFEGGANTGYTMYIGANVLAGLTGCEINYRYHKKADLPSSTADPSAMLIEMSDPNFAVQYMLAARFQNTRTCLV